LPKLDLPSTMMRAVYDCNKKLNRTRTLRTWNRSFFFLADNIDYDFVTAFEEVWSDLPSGVQSHLEWYWSSPDAHKLPDLVACPVILLCHDWPGRGSGIGVQYDFRVFLFHAAMMAMMPRQVMQEVIANQLVNAYISLGGVQVVHLSQCPEPTAEEVQPIYTMAVNSLLQKWGFDPSLLTDWINSHQKELAPWWADEANLCTAII
jgi:hypothetical protein